MALGTKLKSLNFFMCHSLWHKKPWHKSKSTEIIEYLLCHPNLAPLALKTCSPGFQDVAFRLPPSFFIARTFSDEALGKGVIHHATDA